LQKEHKKYIYSNNLDKGLPLNKLEMKEADLEDTEKRIIALTAEQTEKGESFTKKEVLNNELAYKNDLTTEINQLRGVDSDTEESETVCLKKGTDLQKRCETASIIGDTVGDPMKDTSGPSLNILIKLSSIISLVFGSFFIKTSYLVKS